MTLPREHPNSLTLTPEPHGFFRQRFRSGGRVSGKISMDVLREGREVRYGSEADMSPQISLCQVGTSNGLEQELRISGVSNPLKHFCIP